MALEIFRDAWNKRPTGLRVDLEAARKKLQTVTRSIERLVDRIMGTESMSVVVTYEKRLQILERERAALEEKLAANRAPTIDFDTGFRTALRFLSNPLILWRSDCLTRHRIALNATFAGKLTYVPKEGFRTVPKSLPFLLLEQFATGNYELVGPPGFEPGTKGL